MVGIGLGAGRIRKTHKPATSNRVRMDEIWKNTQFFNSVLRSKCLKIELIVKTALLCRVSICLIWVESFQKKLGGILWRQRALYTSLKTHDIPKSQKRYERKPFFLGNDFFKSYSPDVKFESEQSTPDKGVPKLVGIQCTLRREATFSNQLGDRAHEANPLLIALGFSSVHDEKSPEETFSYTKCAFST